jgi:DNA-binding XRE family transcriptional regulator
MERPLDQIIRLPNQLGACVKSARLERKMTQKQLASLIRKQQKTISAIETASPGTKLDTLLSVIAMLDLDLHVAAPRAAHEKPLDIERLYALGLHPYSRMRAERVYSLDEMLDYDRPDQLALQRAAFDGMGIRYGRWLRVTASGAADAWLVLAREHEDFSAAAVSTLSAIAPHLAAALRTFCALVGQRLQTAMAQAALTRLGVGQLALDADGRVMAADPEAERMLSFSPELIHAQGRRLQLLPDAARELEARCAELASSTSGSSSTVLLDGRRGLWLLLRKAELVLQLHIKT